MSCSIWVGVTLGVTVDIRIAAPAGCGAAIIRYAPKSSPEWTT